MKFRIFSLLNKKLSDQLPVKKCIESLKSYAWLVQFLEQPMLYRLLINFTYMGIYSVYRRNIKRNTFQVIGPLLLKPLVYQVVSEHISDHMVICERIIVLV